MATKDRCPHECGTETSHLICICVKCGEAYTNREHEGHEGRSSSPTCEAHGPHFGECGNPGHRMQGFGAPLPAPSPPTEEDIEESNFEAAVTSFESKYKHLTDYKWDHDSYVAGFEDGINHLARVEVGDSGAQTWKEKVHAMEDAEIIEGTKKAIAAHRREATLTTSSEAMKWHRAKIRRLEAELSQEKPKSVK